MFFVFVCDGVGIVEVVGFFVKEFVFGDWVVINFCDVLDDNYYYLMVDVVSMLGIGLNGIFCIMGVFGVGVLVYVLLFLNWF